MPEHTAAPSEQTAPMRLAKILDMFRFGSSMT